MAKESPIVKHYDAIKLGHMKDGQKFKLRILSRVYYTIQRKDNKKAVFTSLGSGRTFIRKINVYGYVLVPEKVLDHSKYDF